MLLGVLYLKEVDLSWGVEIPPQIEAFRLEGDGALGGPIRAPENSRGQGVCGIPQGEDGSRLRGGEEARAGARRPASISRTNSGSPKSSVIWAVRLAGKMVPRRSRRARIREGVMKSLQSVDVSGLGNGAFEVTRNPVPTGLEFFGARLVRSS